jgi:PhzF family phenazine biosynthesis protein
MKLQLFQVDAFTSRPFGGNPAAVVPLAEWLPDGVMQNIAAENNLSETVFFVRDDDHYAIRWFTPQVEVNLCGHATLAAAHVILRELGLETARVSFHSPRSGALSVERQGDRLVLDFPAYPVTEIPAPRGVAEAVGATPARVWETQGNMVLLLLESETQIRVLTPDLNAVLGLPFEEVIVTAPGDDADFVSRMFAPRLGIPEDPVTGAIHCSLIPLWAERLGKQTLFARQVSRRGGELFCQLAGDRVKIGGHARLFLKGELYL